MTFAAATYRLVVADDAVEVGDLLGFLLEETGRFRVVGRAATGAETVEVVATTQPDVALVDADLDGVDLAALRDRSPRTAVVLLGEVAGGRAAAVDAVVAKAIDNRDLAGRLLEVARRHRQDAPAQPQRRAAPAAAIGAGDAGPWLAALLGSSADALVGVGPDRTVVAWNPAAEDLFAATAADVVGAPVSVLGGDLEKLVVRALGGEAVDHYECVHVRGDGSKVTAQVTVLPVAAGGGAVAGALVTARDVSGRLHVEATLSRAVAQLERKNRELLRSNEELDSFATVASHDLAQPLQVAYGFVDMVRAVYGQALDDEGRSWLDHASGALERMRALVADILTYSRTGSGAPDYAPVALADAVGDALAALAVEVRDRGAVVEVGELPTVLGDRRQLALVFQNVIANALKFVPADFAPRVRVATAQLEPGLDAVVTVSDNGVGIPPGQREAAFEMFQRLEASGVPGTGVGLAIVKKIVGRHGGAVWIGDGDGDGHGDGDGAAEPGGGGPGTTVHLRLPLAPARPAPGRPGRARGGAPGTPPAASIDSDGQ